MYRHAFRYQKKIAALFLAGGLMLQSAGCLPSNYFADLAATLLTTAVTAFFNELLQMVLNTATT